MRPSSNSHRFGLTEYADERPQDLPDVSDELMAALLKRFPEPDFFVKDVDTLIQTGARRAGQIEVIGWLRALHSRARLPNN